MCIRIKPTVFLALGLAALPIGAVIGTARADNYPYQGTQSFRVEGTVTSVDADRDRVEITASDGRQYNLDTDDAQIKLRDTSRAGDTGDLVNGMHVEVTGRLLSSDIVAADRVTVLPYEGGSRPEYPARVTRPINTTRVAEVDRIRLRGTVENVDDESGVVVVRVNDHLRTVLVDRNTDLTDISSPSDNQIGLHPGDRVTVTGLLRQDGSVKANAISLSKNISAAERAADAVPQADTDNDGDNAHQIVGRVSHTSDKYFSRDIKVKLDSGREITVHVPHDAHIMRYGEGISVHDLTGDDVVRVIGSYDGDDFKATRIDVLRPYGDEQ